MGEACLQHLTLRSLICWLICQHVLDISTATSGATTVHCTAACRRISKTLGPFNVFILLSGMDLFAWYVRLSRLSVSFRAHLKSTHFRAFIHSCNADAFCRCGHASGCWQLAFLRRRRRPHKGSLAHEINNSYVRSFVHIDEQLQWGLLLQCIMQSGAARWPSA